MANVGHQSNTHSHCLGHKTIKEQTFLNIHYIRTHTHTFNHASVHRHSHTHSRHKSAEIKTTRQTDIQRHQQIGPDIKMRENKICNPSKE